MNTILTSQAMYEFEKIALHTRNLNILRKAMMKGKMSTPSILERQVAKAESVPTFMRKPEDRITKSLITKIEPVPETIIAEKKPKIKEKVMPAAKGFGRGVMGAAGLASLGLLGGAMVASRSSGEY